MAALRGTGTVWFVDLSPEAAAWREVLTKVLTHDGIAVCRFYADELSSTDAAADRAASVVRGLEDVDVAVLVGPMALSPASEAAAQQLLPGAFFVDAEILRSMTPGEAASELMQRIADSLKDRR